MHEPQIYDVWLMRVENPDHPGVGKVRPVIVTHVDDDRLSGIVVKVTSVTTWGELGDVKLLDWQQEGLYKPSTARCSQRFWFGTRDLLKHFGRLSPRDALSIDAGLKGTGDIRPTAMHDCIDPSDREKSAAASASLRQTHDAPPLPHGSDGASA